MNYSVNLNKASGSGLPSAHGNGRREKKVRMEITFP
jgi:hypothetical protein